MIEQVCQMVGSDSVPVKTSDSLPRRLDLVLHLTELVKSVGVLMSLLALRLRHKPVSMTQVQACSADSRLLQMKRIEG